MEEIFIGIEDYPGYYVSNLGNVLSFNGKDGKEKLLKPCLAGRYLVVGLTKNKKAKTIHLHRLIAKAFVPNPNNYDSVHHINGNRLDNRVNNLIWIDGSEHIRKHRSTKKRIGCYDKKGNLIKIYSSTHESALDGHYGCNVLRCCRNKPHHNTYHGFIWKFID